MTTSDLPSSLNDLKSCCVFQENCERVLLDQLEPEKPQFFHSPDVAQAVQEIWADEIMPASMECFSKFYLMDTTG
jgi:hypothetical protein